MNQRFHKKTNLSKRLAAGIVVVVLAMVGCKSGEKVTGDQLLGPGNQYGAGWNGSQDEYEKVRHVKPKLVASTPTEKRKTVEERFLDGLTQSDPEIEKAKRYFFEAESIYNDAVRLRQTANGSNSQMRQAGELFLQAGRRYQQAAEYWTDSALHEDAQFMAAAVSYTHLTLPTKA